MSTQGEQILRQALSLSAEERRAVAERLLSSLATADQERIQRLWAAEAENRVDAFERGEIPADSAPDILKKAGK